MTKVLVTGADGFIGSHLVELLIQQGFDVRAFCLYNSLGSCGWLDTLPDSIKSKIEFVLGDICDPVSVREAMRDCAVVYHLAALISIPYSYLAPSSYIQTNINGTLNVIQAARDLDTPRVLITSTSETYGTAQYVPINESHPLVGQSPYAATKIAADQLALSFWRSFGTPITVVRPFNTYGPRQSARAVIPTIITQIASGRKTITLGSLTPTRDFNYVADTCRAFVEISNCTQSLGMVVNVCSAFEISIGQTVELISEILGINIEIKTDDSRIRPKLSEVNRLYGDNSLLCQLTKWQPSYGKMDGFRRGLEITSRWFLDPSNMNFYKPEKYNI
jgi:NAD dependent epimerase/dehydratase